MRGAKRVLVGKPDRNKQLGRPQLRWEDDIKTDLQEWNVDMDWFAVAQNKDRWRTVVNAVMNLRFPYNVENFLTS
jgi:hypothetical protein